MDKKKHVKSSFFFHVARRHEDFDNVMDLLSPYNRGPALYVSFSSDKKFMIRRKRLDYIDNLGCIIASSNSLLLLSHSPMNYFVCDPCTKKHVELPQTNRTYSCVGVAFLCEINDRDDEFSMSYKVVCVHADSKAKKRTHNIETYSSKTGEWKESLVTASSEFCFGPNVAKVIKGVFYWLDSDVYKFVVYDTKNTEGRLKLIELPPPPPEYKRYEEITTECWDYIVCEARDGKLQLIGFIPHVEVWVLDEKRGGTADIIGGSCWIFINKILLTSFGVDYDKSLSFVCVDDHEEMLFLNEEFKVESFKQYVRPVWPLLF